MVPRPPMMTATTTTTTRTTSWFVVYPPTLFLLVYPNTVSGQKHILFQRNCFTIPAIPAFARPARPGPVRPYSMMCLYFLNKNNIKSCRQSVE